jgi:DNA-binding CsgD family transcriptional regulator/tetratricopeptide (TPR) repeat protein
MKKLPILIITTILVIMACGGNNNDKILNTTDSLLQKSPDKALRLLDSIGLDDNFSHNEKMHYIWNKAKSHQMLGASLIADSLLPEAVEYYREHGDAEKQLESYLLMASYLSWTDKNDKAIVTLDSGYHKAEAMGSTEMMMTFLGGETELYYRNRDYKKAIVKIKEMLKFADKIPLQQQSHLIYMLGLNLSLTNDKSYHMYYKKSIDMALAAGDTASACEYMRNYAGSLSGDHKYKESNNMLHEIGRLMPQIGRMSAIQMNMAENYVNLHRLESARICFNAATESEKMLQSEGHSDIARKGSFELLKYLINYESGQTVSAAPFSRYCDSITNDIMMRHKTEVKQLEDRQRLQTINYELHVERNRLWWYLFSLITVVALACVGIYGYIRNRYARLAEAEARVETLTRLVEEAKTSTAETPQASDDAFFKKILMKQLGIIKLVASNPTSHNQALLKRISAISEGEIPVDELLSWPDIYPIIDSLYDNFYTRLRERFGSVLTDKEVKICCLLRASFSTKEIGIVTQQTDATVYVRKTSIRKKIGTSEKQNIVDFINEFR